jgi:hypothetical protein
MMTRKVALLALGLAVASPVAVRAQVPSSCPGAGCPLAFLIPTLYGPAGLKVESQALLPDGSTHSAHFNSAFQAEFTLFNTSLASQLASVPLPSPASGFTYELDPALGVMKRSTQSFGPIFAERADTIGRKKFSLGVNYQRFSFDTIEGIDLTAVPAVFTHDGAAPGGKADVVSTMNSISLGVDQFTAFLSYGLADFLDFSVAVPLVRVDMTVTSNATIQRIGTASNPKIHFFSDPAAAGGYGNTKSFTNTGNASGIGDLILRLKGTAIKSGHTGLALALDVRLPTGDENNFLGSGAAGVKPFLAFSFSAGRVSPHVNFGYQWNGKSVLAGNILTGEKQSLPNQYLYALGADIGLGQKITLAFDVLGRRVINSPRLQSQTFTPLQNFTFPGGGSTLPDIHFSTSSFNITNGAVGLKLNAGGNLLVDLNGIFKLDNAGLRAKFTPLFGVEYSF